MNTTTLISKYNALDGKKVSKAQLVKLQTEAENLHPVIYKKLTAAIQQINGHKAGYIKISEPIKVEKSSKKKVVSSKKKVVSSKKATAKKKETNPTPAVTSSHSEKSPTSEVQAKESKSTKPEGYSHASEKTETQNDDTIKPIVTSKKAKKPTEKSPNKKRAPRKPKTATLSGLPGFTRADQAPAKPEGELFTLPGEVGKWLGEQQRFRLVISLDGETHAGKSELAKKIMNAFADKGFIGVWNDLEQGGMESKDTRASFERNATKANMQRIFVGGGPLTLDQLEEQAKNPDIDVIALDSAGKVKTGSFSESNSWMDDLRVKYPNKIFIAIWQQNAKGGTRGGPSAEFDAPVHIKVYRPDHTDYKGNYAEFLKNRGNATDKTFRLHDNKIMDINLNTDE